MSYLTRIPTSKNKQKCRGCGRVPRSATEPNCLSKGWRVLLPSTLVLGYNWLTRYNPLIDWVLSSIIFPANRVENPISELMSLRATISEELETTDTTKPHDYDSESHDSKSYEPDTPASMNPPNYAKIDIALVNAVAYQCACQLPRSQSFVTYRISGPRIRI